MASPKPSKKSSGGSPRSYSEVYKNSAKAGAPTAQVASPAPAKGAAPKSMPAKSVAPGLSGSDSVDWWGEYGYVLNDLKVLGLTTFGLLAAIIVVGLFM